MQSSAKMILVIASTLTIYTFLHCGSTATTQKDAPPQVMDYIHQPTIHPTLIIADRTKWAQDYLQAIAHYQKALKEGDLKEGEKNYVFNQMAYCYLFMDQEELAQPYLQQIEQSTALSSKEIQADYLFNKGMYLLAVDTGEQAIAYLNVADSLYLELYGISHLRRLQVLTATANAYLFYSSKQDSADLLITEALDLLGEDSLYAPYSAQSYLAKANVVRHRRSYIEGLTYVDLALNLARKAPYFDTLFVGNCHNAKGHMLKKLKRMQEARKELKEAIRLGELKRGDNERLKEFYEGMIVTYMLDQDSVQFHYYLNKLKARFTYFPNAMQNPKTLEAYFNYNAGHHQRAMQSYTELVLAYSDRKETNNNFYGEAYYVLAEAHRELGNFKQALSYIDQMIELKFGAEHIPTSVPRNDLTAFNKLKVKARLILLVFYSKKPNTFLSHYEKDSTQVAQLFKAVEWYQAIDSIFFQHAEVIDENSLLTFAQEHFHSTYSKALRACYLAYQVSKKEKYLQVAHQMLERVKYTLLYRDMLAGENTLEAKAPATLLSEEQQVNESLSILRQQKIQNPTQTNTVADQQMLQLLRRQTAIYQELKKYYPDYFFSRMQQNIATLSNLQSLLAEEQQAAIQYHMGEGYLSTFVLLPDSVIFLQQPLFPQFLEQIKTYQALLNNPELAYRPSTFQKFTTVAHQLYQVFFTPIEAAIKDYPNLVICPDASTALLPFNALLTHVVTDSSSDYRSLPYLLHEHELTYVFSMKNYWYQQQNNQQLSPAPHILAYAFSESQSAGPIAGLFRKKPLEEIEGTARELKAIEKVYGEEGQHFRYGLQSTRSDFLQQMPQGYDIIHLALHAESDNADRYNSRIYFRSEANRDSNEMLYGHEIEKMEVTASLVVLSACETATGEVSIGEGTFSLARSFLVAGAGQVVSSLWAVDDTATQALMSAFYRQLYNSQEVGHSLTLAQEDYLKGADHYRAFPGYWAGFILVQ